MRYAFVSSVIYGCIRLNADKDAIVVEGDLIFGVCIWVWCPGVCQRA